MKKLGNKSFLLKLTAAVGCIAALGATVYVVQRGKPRVGPSASSTVIPASTAKPIKPPSPSSSDAMTADRATAKRASFEISTTANGELESRNKIEIRSQLDQQSTVVRIVPEGTRVKAGDELIALNVEEIQLKVDDEKLRVESARADFQVAQNNFEIQEKDNESQLRQARLKVELAELAMEQWEKGDAIKKRNELDLGVEKARLELSRLADVYVRSQELFAEGFLSKDQMNQDEVSYVEAIAQYRVSTLAMDVYLTYEQVKDRKKFESDGAEAREELEKTKLNSRSELASKLADANNKREQLAGLERRLAKLTKQRDDATIKADRDGLVVYGSSIDRNQWGRGGGDSSLTIGSNVYPNQLLMILPDTSEMIASVRVHESMAGRVRIGQIVSVKIDAAGGVTFRGQVESIGVMAETGGWRDPNLREYAIRVSLETGDFAGLKPAMRCEGRITLDSVVDVLTIPVQAVYNEGPVQFIYTPSTVRGGRKFERVPVRIGRKSDTLVEVTKGIAEDQVVLLRQPAAGEIISAPFQADVLIAAGYRLDDEGKVLAEGGFAGGSMPGAVSPARGGGGAAGGAGGGGGEAAGGKGGKRPVGNLGDKAQLDTQAISANSVPAEGTKPDPIASQDVQTKSTDATRDEVAASKPEDQTPRAAPADTAKPADPQPAEQAAAQVTADAVKPPKSQDADTKDKK